MSTKSSLQFNIFGKDTDKKVPLRMHQNTPFQVNNSLFLEMGHSLSSQTAPRWEWVPPTHTPSLPCRLDPLCVPQNSSEIYATVCVCVCVCDRYFNDTLSIFCEFIPQLIFLLSIFGYLIILIVYKWMAIDATEAACAPSLLIGICLLLSSSPGVCSGTAGLRSAVTRQQDCLNDFNIFANLLLCITLCQE